MNRPSLNNEQIAVLLRNPNIDKCSPKSIGYSKDFKIRAVKQYEEQGLSALQIFKEAGFDLSLLNREKRNSCLKYWRKAYQAKGLQGLEVDGRGRTKGGKGGRPKIRGMTDADHIKRLELTVAYLKAENDFLAKLRAQKAE